MESGAIIRGDSSRKRLALVFSADTFADGGNIIRNTLKRKETKASFFFTGHFYEDASRAQLARALQHDGHYLGPHSYGHLLYCDWTKRDSLLVSREVFKADLNRNYERMEEAGLKKEPALFFLPPYEWYNDSIAQWARDMGIQLVNFTPGSRSNADYTWPGLSNYRSSRQLFDDIERAAGRPSGLNGHLLLLHLGTDPRRKDKFYRKLGKLIDRLTQRGYSLVRIDELLSDGPAEGEK